MINPIELFTVTSPKPVENESRSSLPSPRRRNFTIKTSPTMKLPKDGSVNPEVEIWVARALRGEDISDIDPDLVPGVVQSLSRQQEFMVENGFFHESQEAYKAFQMALKLQREANDKILQRMVQEDLRERMYDTQDDMNHLANESVTIKNNMEKEFTERLNKLMNKHDRQIKRFCDKWGTSKQKYYNKTSELLKILRYQEDKYLFARIFDQYKLCLKAADMLEQEEVGRNQQRMEFDFKLALHDLLMRQRAEVDVLQKKFEDERKMYSGAEEQAKDLILIRANKLNNEYDKSLDLRAMRRRQLKYQKGPDSLPRFCPISFNRMGREESFKDVHGLYLPPLKAAKRIQYTKARRDLSLSQRSEMISKRLADLNETIVFE